MGLTVASPRFGASRGANLSLSTVAWEKIKACKGGGTKFIGIGDRKRGTFILYSIKIGENIFRQMSCKIRVYCLFCIHIFSGINVLPPKLTGRAPTPMTKLAYNMRKPVTKVCMHIHVWKVKSCRDGQKMLYWTANRVSRKESVKWVSPKINHLEIEGGHVPRCPIAGNASGLRQAGAYCYSMKLFLKNSNVCSSQSTNVTDGRTTYHDNTALCYISGGKNLLVCFDLCTHLINWTVQF